MGPLDGLLVLLLELASPPARLEGGERALGAVPGIGEHSAAIGAEFA